MKTYKAYRLMNANKEKPEALIWWDGTRTQSSDSSVLSEIKSITIPLGTKEKPTIKYGDGLQFFNSLTFAYKSGYQWLEPTKVDEKGKEVTDGR